jgi:hypothetical protein
MEEEAASGSGGGAASRHVAAVAPLRRRVHPSTAGEYLKEAVQRRRRDAAGLNPVAMDPSAMDQPAAGGEGAGRPRRRGGGGHGGGRAQVEKEPGGGRRRQGGGGVDARLRCSTPGIARRGGAPAKCSKRCRLRWSSYISHCCCILQMQQRLQTPLDDSSSKKLRGQSQWVVGGYPKNRTGSPNTRERRNSKRVQVW